jgi:hypothetical protein
MMLLQRRVSVSALIGISTLLACGFSLTGCVTPIHQNRAAESFAKGYLALADFFQYESVRILEGTAALEATTIALQPGNSLHNDQLMEQRIRFQALRLTASRIMRIYATFPASILEDDRDELLRKAKAAREAVNQTASFMSPNVELLPSDITPAQEEKIRSASKEVIAKRFADRIPKSMTHSLGVMKDTFTDPIKYTNILAPEVSRRAARIIEDPERPLLARLAALEKYNAASQVPYQTEVLAERLEAVFNGAIAVTTDMGKALQDTNYKKEDLQAFIAKVDEVVSQIEKVTGTLKRIGTLVGLL